MIKGFLILTFMMFFSHGAFAQEAFLEACHAPKSKSESVQNDIKWFQFLYKTKDCQKIAAKLSKLTSLSQIIQPWMATIPELQSSWVNSFDDIYGNFSIYQVYEEWIITNNVKKNIFKEIELYADFPNITSLGYFRATQLPYEIDVCKVLDLFPNLVKISIDIEFFNEQTDQCIADRNLAVIITKAVETFGSTPIKSDVIGIEQYMGVLTELLQFNNLKYLGITDKVIMQGEEEDVIRVNGRIVNEKKPIPPVALAILGGLTNLTHLTLASSNIAKIHELKHSYNLTWLSISCAATEYKLDKSPCAKNLAYLKNLDFMSKLTWLEYLDLNYNWLETIPDFQALTHLKTLKLRGNLIKELPWKKSHPSLEYVDLSGNKLIEIDNLKHLKNLSFLNLSGNKISDFSPLSFLNKIKFLNLSNNVFQKDLTNLNPGPDLKVLSLNGACNPFDLFETIFTEHLADYRDPEASLYMDVLYGDFNIQDQSLEFQEIGPTEVKFWKDLRKNICQGSEMISSNADFSKFKNLEVLSIRYNKLKNLPNLKGNTSLKLINLEGNQIKSLNSQLLPKSLTVLLMPLNQIKDLPKLTDFPSLMKIDFSGNVIRSLKDLKIPNKNMTLVLAGNHISNIDILNSPGYLETVPTLYGNPINPKKCPQDSKNVDLAYYCEGANNGYSTGELDSIGLQ